MSSEKEHVILVVGHCGLDRLHTVSTYPVPDSKVLTTAYHEVGGGNAANTATAMARLSNAVIFKPKNICVKLCAKIGDDPIGRQLTEELIRDGVDISSPLFLVGQGTTTGFTTVVVSEQEQTRTCIHTPGSCGEIKPQDLSRVDLDEVFENVVHLHSDARHTDAALLLVQEAVRRKIPISLDVEKDRHVKSLDELLRLADIVFTNSKQIEDYLSRLTREFEEMHSMHSLGQPEVVAHGLGLGESDMADLCAHVVQPSVFFSRWYCQKGKEVVITKGDQGAIHVRCDSVVVSASNVDESEAAIDRMEISVASPDLVRIHHKFTDHSTQLQLQSKSCSASYTIRTAGVLSGLSVVDTTGAGDAFIGGYLLSRLITTCCSDPDLGSLQFGCWVGGKKLAGPGARSALPRGTDVDNLLGVEPAQVQEKLAGLLAPFRRAST